ncbi:hypothetical protein HanPI659440_Chr13g0510711 [Helianthus annuus]|nr:hypothetical protein HanPI659440_Chr13g0510711 [Helianthus annuus]
MDKKKNVRKNKQKKKDEKDEFYVYPTESENENEESFENESEENDEDDAEEQPITLLKAATDWIDQENQENVQNSPIKTIETEKTPTKSGGSWGQFFIKPSRGNKDKMWVDSQSRLRNFMPSQNQSEGLSDIHSTKSGDENMKNIEDKKSHEYLVTVLDDHLKGFEEIFENIQSRIDEIVEEYPNSEALHNKVNECVSLIEKLNHQAKKHKKVNIDSTMMETPSRFLNLSQNEDTKNQIISTPLIIKRDDDDAKRNEDNTAVVQSSNPEKISNNDPASILQTHIEKPSMEQSSFSEETPSLMLEMIKKTDEEEKKSNQKKIQDNEVPSFDLKISQLSSNVDENEVEVDATPHAAQTEIQAESENRSIEKDVQITGIQTMFDRIEEQDNTEKQISDLIQNTSFLNPQEDPYKTPAKSVHQEQPTTDISKTEEIITRMVRPDREKNLPEVFCSPYYLRQVAMKEARTAHENNISGYAFHAEGEMM